MADQARFWDRIAAKYATQPIADAAVYERKLAQTRARLRPDWEIVEFGCGTGNTAIAHAAHVAQVHAVDFSAKMLAFGEDRARREGIDNITFERASVAGFAPGRRYDAVLMLSLLHLLADWRGAIDKARALVRPGGIFVTSTTCLAEYPALLRLGLRLARPFGLVPEVAVITPEALTEAIAARGFDIEENWQPAPRKAHFIIARRAADAG